MATTGRLATGARTSVTSCRSRLQPLQRPRAFSASGQGTHVCSRRHQRSRLVAAAPLAADTLRRLVTCHSRGAHHVYLFGSEAPITVCKVHIGLFGRVKEVQNALDRIASTAGTGETEELFQIMQETITLLLGNMSFVSYAYAGTSGCDDMESAEAKFNSTSLSERAKFSNETMVNYAGIRSQSAVGASGGIASDGWLCVTFLAAADKVVKFPSLASISDAKNALLVLSDITPDELLAFELLWTPQEAGDVLTKDQMLLDYPQLRLV